MGGERERERERGNCVPFKKRKKERGNCDNLLLSEDVLIQILLWLPVISLLRFKSVCKSWRAIIESPFFIHLHATTTLLPSSFSSSSSSSNLVGGSNVVFNGGEEHKEKEKRGKFFKLSGEEFEVFEDLGRPPLMDHHLGGKEFEVLMNKYKLFMDVRFRVVGCCNGIICLHHYFSRNIILWNPAIKQSRVLPKPSNLLGNPNCYDKFDLDDDDDDGYYAEDFVMFGIDVKTMDYKVLLLTTLQPHETYSGTDDDDDDNAEERRFMRSRSPLERRVHVYSLSTDSWRCIDTTLTADHHPYLKISRSVNGGHYLNGSHFFMASYMIKVKEHFYSFMPLIMSFDFTEEIFRTIHSPVDLMEKYSSGCTNYFIPFGEKLALAVIKRKKLCGCFYRSKLEGEVWVLNVQHGVKESWTKFCYTFGNSPTGMGLRCIAINGKFAIIYHVRSGIWKFLLLNLITGETKELQSDCHSQVRFDLNVRIYKPSLVQIGRSGAPTNEKCDSTL